jgi:Coenzyme PQQ synthesis protein D (PqqD)
MTASIGLRNDELTWRMVDNEVVLLDLRTSQYFSVNGAGSVLWELLADGTTPVRLSEELVQRYGLDPDQAARDVDRFLATLEAHGLLRRDIASSIP